MGMGRAVRIRRIYVWTASGVWHVKCTRKMSACLLFRWKLSFTQEAFPASLIQAASARTLPATESSQSASSGKFLWRLPWGLKAAATSILVLALPQIWIQRNLILFHLTSMTALLSFPPKPKHPQVCQPIHLWLGSKTSHQPTSTQKYSNRSWTQYIWLVQTSNWTVPICSKAQDLTGVLWNCIPIGASWAQPEGTTSSSHKLTRGQVFHPALCLGTRRPQELSLVCWL